MADLAGKVARAGSPEQGAVNEVAELHQGPTSAGSLALDQSKTASFHNKKPH